MSPPTILIGYDGSAGAQAALEHAAQMFPGAHAVVVSVWEGLSEVLARAGAGHGAAALDMDDIDATSERLAAQRADAGAEHARQRGLDAEGRARGARGPVWETILQEAEELDAAAVVVGTRGLTGLKSMLLGSVSHGVLGHCDRPVVVVPPVTVAARRTAERRR